MASQGGGGAGFGNHQLPYFSSASLTLRARQMSIVYYFFLNCCLLVGNEIQQQQKKGYRHVISRECTPCFFGVTSLYYE